MGAIRGTYTNGTVILGAPADWPEGTEVRVEPTAEATSVGIREEDWPTDPVTITAFLAGMNQIQPFLSPEEDDAWRRALADQKAFELANWDKRAKDIGEMFR